MTAASDSLIQFPCDFPIKVMGTRSDDFAQGIVAVVLEHAPDFRPETVEMRASSNGNYLSVTCTVRAISQAQLDTLYRALTAQPGVKIVL